MGAVGKLLVLCVEDNEVQTDFALDSHKRSQRFLQILSESTCEFLYDTSLGVWERNARIGISSFLLR
jgi:hypothetical protein